MKITFLGTGTSQGIPVIACDCQVCKSENPKDDRLRTSVLLEVGGKVFVIDTGPDFRQQMLRQKVSHLDAVIFTHEHKDHVAGMDDVRAFNYKQKKDMPVYGSANVEEALHREYAYVFAESKYPGIPRIDFRLIGNESFNVDGITFQPVEVLHHKLPVMGFRVGNFAYVTDANFISEEEKDKLRGLDVLVLNALRKEKHVSHFTLQEAIDLSRELGANQTFFTHISHMMGLHAEVSAELPDSVQIAYDGLVVEIQ